MPNTKLAIKEIQIQIRNKANTLKGHCSEDTLVAAIRQFLKMQFEDAFDLLWRLKYNPTEAKDNILKELGLSLKMVPNLSLLESELGYQYRQHVDTTFLKPPKQSSAHSTRCTKLLNWVIARLSMCTVPASHTSPWQTQISAASSIF